MKYSNKKLIEIIIFMLIVFISINSIIFAAQIKKNKNITYLYNHLEKVYHPSDYKMSSPKKISIKRNDLLIYLYSRNFKQGDAVYVEIYMRENIRDKKFRLNGVKFEKRKVFMGDRSWGYRGFFAIPSYENYGEKDIIVEYSVNNELRIEKFKFKIKKTRFHVYKKALDFGKYSNMDYQDKPDILRFIKKCFKKKRQAFKSSNADLMSTTLAHPRDMHYITSPFWSKRVYYRYRVKEGKKVRITDRVKIHKGLDLRGKEGAPVFAIGNGKIVLAEKFFYEGNMIIIDHGNKIFSYFMHLSKILVKKGNLIKAGDKVGLVGTTGFSTAPHLHVSFMINKVQVDPLSVLSLPIHD